MQTESFDANGCGTADVEKAFERGDEDRRPERAWGLVVPDNRVHMASMPPQDLNAALH